MRKLAHSSFGLGLFAVTSPAHSTRTLASSSHTPPSSERGEAGARQTRRTRKGKRSTSPSRKISDARFSPSQQFTSPYVTTGTGFYDTTEVPKSLDISARGDLMDVEKFFPEAMAHLKQQHPTTPAVADAKEDRMWHDVTHTLNVDGFRPRDRPSEEDEEAQSRSFFDQGSLDIRGGLRDLHKVRPGQRQQPPQTHSERLSPDILQLSGGKPRLHGAALAAKSNAAPADQTLEPEDGHYMGKNGDQGSDFGDTPVQLTDMLRERLMELKGNKLREDRNDAFMPRRLALKTDAELARERQQLQQRRKGEEQQLLLQLANKAAPPKTKPTLADLMDPAEGSGFGEADAAPAPAILRDGVSEEQRKQAASTMSRAHAYGGDSRQSSEIDPLSDLDHPFGAGFAPNHGDGAAKDSVYLLRVLPRASFCSRREASVMIASGQVRVNNVVERNPFRHVKPEDDVHVAGHTARLRFAPPRLWVYHKPANVVVSRNDVAGRTLIGKHARILGMDHLIPVGSLPMRAHGILLLTNDGELSRYLENPRANLQQTYLLRVRPAMDAVLAHKLNTQGITINGRQYKGAMEFLVNPAAKSRYSVKVKIRNDSLPIAHVMQHLGRTIERGGRMSFGPFSLSTLPVGSLREVTVPSFYADHLGAVWRPFVERDWPYFRRQRVSRLRRLARFRQLTPRESEELDNFTYEEMHEALRLDEQELAAAATAREEDLWKAKQRPSFSHGQALPRDFPTATRHDGGDCVDTLEGMEWAQGAAEGDDYVIEDITSVV